MECAKCKAPAAIESLVPLIPGIEMCGLKTEWLCLGCAREKCGLPREEPPEPPKKGKRHEKKKTASKEHPPSL